MNTKLIVLTLWLISHAASYAQVSGFGSFSKQDWDIKYCSFDTNSYAFILFDYGNVEIRPIADIRNNIIECPLKIEFYEISLTRRLRLKVVDTTGLKLDPLVFTLKAQGPLKDKLTYFRAIVTWKERNKTKSIKFNSKSLIEEEYGTNGSIMKFIFGELSEGCIVDVEYRTTSNIFDELPGWNFNLSLPSYYSEYSITVPDFLTYERISGLTGLVPKDKLMSNEKCDVWFLGTDGNYTFKEYWYFNTTERYILTSITPSSDSGDSGYIRYLLKKNNIRSVYGKSTRMIANPTKR